MKISVVIPAFNEENYIGACLDHIRENGGALINEIIVVDNGSTDATRDIASQKGAIVLREPQKGANRARQAGLIQAKSDYVAFLDADTRMQAGWPGKVEYFFKNKPIIALTGPYKYFDADRFTNVVMAVLWKISLTILKVARCYGSLAGNFVVKKDAMLAIGGFDSNILFYGDDTDTARRLSKQGKILFTDKFYIYSSCRRYAHEGLLKTNFIYLMNFLWEVIFKKPFPSTYKYVGGKSA